MDEEAIIHEDNIRKHIMETCAFCNQHLAASSLRSHAFHTKLAGGRHWVEVEPDATQFMATYQFVLIRDDLAGGYKKVCLKCAHKEGHVGPDEIKPMPEPDIEP